MMAKFALLPFFASGLHHFSKKSCHQGSKPLFAILALEKLASPDIRPDIILLDLVMPVMDGFEFLEKIKKEKLDKGAIIIILSNLGQEGDIERAIKMGADGYIIKASATPTEVVTKVEQILEKRGKG